MNYPYKLYLCGCVLAMAISQITTINVNAQGVGINPSGSAPNSSAALDVDFTDKGLLIPRLTTTQRNAITSPSFGLQIINTTDSCLQIYLGQWISVKCATPCVPASPGQIAGLTLVSFNQAGVSYSVTPVSGATYYSWSVPPGATINSGQGTTSINVTFGTTPGNICVTAISHCGTSPQTCLSVTVSYCTSNTWTKKTDFGGTGRYGAIGFSIGNKGYIGTGWNGSVYTRDFWEWDQATNLWTQKADLTGAERYIGVAFSIGTKGYIGTGYNGITLQDFWEWDQATNVWVQKANYGTTAIRVGAGFSIGTKGYIGLGTDGTNNRLDFWEWNQATNLWTQKANFSGAARLGAVSFSIGTKGYIGLGDDGTPKQDFWEWDQAANTWTQKANFGGLARNQTAGFSIGNKGYVGTGYNSASTYYQDFWEWDQASNTWTQKANFANSGPGRRQPVGFSIGTKGYIGTGINGSTYYQEFWEWCQ